MSAYFLSPQQRRLWLVQDKAKRVFVTKCCLQITGSLDRELLRESLEELTGSQPALRTVFRLREGLQFPLQEVKPYQRGELRWQCIDGGGPDADAAVEAAYNARITPDEIRYTLIRRSDDLHLLVVVAPALALDGYSLRQLVEQLLGTYGARRAGTAPEGGPAIEYPQYAEWQNETIADKSVEFWNDPRFGNPEALALPAERAAGAPSGATASVSLEGGAALSAAVAGMAEADRAPFLFGCWNALLHRLSGNPRFVSGFTAHGKDYAELAHTLGLFARVLPVPVAVDADDEVAGLGQRVSQELAELADWQDYYLLGAAHGQFAPGSAPAFIPYGFEYQDYTLPGPYAPGLAARLLRYHGDHELVKLKATVLATGEGLQLHLDYDPAAFAEEEVRRIGRFFGAVAADAAAGPRKPVGRLSLLDGAARDAVLYGFNETALDVPGGTLVELFEARVQQLPGALAVWANGQSLTYAQLNERANRLAHALRRGYGVRPGEPVALVTDRSADLIAALLGILKAGGAYLPLDTGWPPERLALVLHESRCRLVVTQTAHLDRLPAGVEKVRIDGDLPGEETADPAPVNRAGDLAYVIFTSGSTGKPKGVMIDHQTVVNLCYGLRERGALPGADACRFSLFASCAFDASVQQIFGSLLFGHSLYLIDDDTRKDVHALFGFLRNCRIEVFDCTPSVLQLLLEELGAAFGQLPLRTVLVGGEAWSGKLLGLFYREALDKTGIRFCNVYGPTECGVDSTLFSPNGQPPFGQLPIGRPLPNKKIYVLDEAMQPLPVGMEGEIYIGGRGIARGYLHNEALTRERFIPSPFVPGETLYRSGDAGKWLPDGNLLFTGRKDDQVKIRGYRVEPGEIAATLRAHEGVQEAYVLLDGDDQAKVLTAVVVPHKKNARAVHQLLRYRDTRPDLLAGLYTLPNGLPVWYANKSELDLIYDEIFTDQTYVRNAIKVREGDVIFDVGANIGLFSLFMGLHFSAIKLYAFEPLEPVHAILERNASLHGLDIKTFNVGLSDAEGVVDFHYYPGNTVLSGRYGDKEEEKSTVKNYLFNKSAEKSASLTPREFDRLLDESIHSVAVQCRMRRLSDVIREQQIDRIDLLKIDAEKSEWEVLSGIEAADWPRIRQLVIEVHDRSGELERVETLLRGQGYYVHTEQDFLLKNTCLYNVYATREVVPAAGPAAVVRPWTPGRQHWVSEQALLQDVKLCCQNHLPEYMVPARWHLVAELPLNQSGKIDRGALARLTTQEEPPKPAVSPRTEIETLLIQVWQEVLGLKEVHVSDDFFIIGGDSIKAIQVSSRLFRAGYKISIRDILYHPVLSDLAPLVKSVKKTADQVVVTGPVPLLPIQQEFFATGRRSPHHFNLSMLFFAPDRLNPVHVREVFAKIWEHHDALRMVFRQADGQWQQRNRGLEAGFGFEVFDFRGEKYFSEPVFDKLRELQSGLDLGEGPLLKIGLFQVEDGDRLLVVIHHLVVDGVSWRILFEDIDNLFRQKASGQPLQLPAKTNSFKEWADKLVAYANSSAFLRQKAYWQNVENQPVEPLPVQGDKTRNAIRDTAQVSFELDESETLSLLTEANKAFSTKINDLLLTGVGLSLKKVFNQQKPVVMLEGHGREDILKGVDVSRTVGWFTSLYPVVLDTSFAEDLARQIREVKNYLNTIPENGVGYGILKHLSDRGSGPGGPFRLQPEVSFNYLGQFDEDTQRMTLELSGEWSAEDSCPDDNRAFLIDVIAQVSGKRLNVSLMYNKHHFDRQHMQALAGCYKAELQRIIAYCSQVEEGELTPSDFGYKGLSIGDLESFFS
ncbi:MAG: amino acid adenylation domain-containing protein [Cytophagales bacterium]|nr:amino acid adenylation domain-containing protein [Cytophagales bacterium]